MVSETWQLTNPILTFMDVFFWNYFFRRICNIVLLGNTLLYANDANPIQYGKTKSTESIRLEINQSVDCQILIMACWSCNFQNNAKVANPCLKIRKSWIYMYCTLGKFDSGWQSRSTNSVVMTTQFSSPVWLKLCWDSQEKLDIYISWVYNPFKLNYGY